MGTATGARHAGIGKKGPLEKIMIIGKRTSTISQGKKGRWPRTSPETTRTSKGGGGGGGGGKKGGKQAGQPHTIKKKKKVIKKRTPRGRGRHHDRGCLGEKRLATKPNTKTVGEGQKNRFAALKGNLRRRKGLPPLRVTIPPKNRARST